MAISIGGDWGVDKRLPKVTLTKRKRLAKLIVNEHFIMTLYDPSAKIKNINYLWWMYKSGQKTGKVNHFMWVFELNLLVSLKLISEDEKDSILNMMSSEDPDNYYIALLAIENLRKKRIKIHGQWDYKLDVSQDLKDVVIDYSNKVINDYILPLKTTL